MLSLPTEPTPTIAKNNDKVLLSVVDMDWCELGVAYAKTVFDNLQVLCWDTGDPEPDYLHNWEGDWIISYRGDFIFPQKFLSGHVKEQLIFIQHLRNIVV